MSFLLTPPPPQRGSEEEGRKGLGDFGWRGTLGAPGTRGAAAQAPMNDPADTKATSGSSAGRESCPTRLDCPRPTRGHPVRSPPPGIATPGTALSVSAPPARPGGGGTGSEGRREAWGGVGGRL